MAAVKGFGDNLRTGQYDSILLSNVSSGGSEDSASTTAHRLIKAFATDLAGASASNEPASVQRLDVATDEALVVCLAAFNAFLQANVTGPVLPNSTALETRFIEAWRNAQPETKDVTIQKLRKECLRHLEVDGVSPYAYIPHLELFAFARYIVFNVLNLADKANIDITSSEGVTKFNVAWIRLRIQVWHCKLLTQPSLGPGSNFTRSSQWSDVPTLASQILEGIDSARKDIIGEDVWATGDSWTRDDKVQFLIESANNYILLGRDIKARELVKEATETSGLKYALSGALGKRTKFQEKNISQLVVLARSGNGTNHEDDNENDSQEVKPDALQLNNDTLLEEISFSKEQDGHDSAKKEILPTALADLAPDNQPQLSPLDQIILLTEATIKDAFSPLDSLTSEEVLPFAVRVISDKSTNWQIFTQALLVRSRIEIHRSRTIERGVLQLQAVADQVLTDTTAEASNEQQQRKIEEETDAPTIQITAPDATPTAQPNKPTSFLPAPKASDSAPAHIRLQYIHALSSPPRWHLESELAYAWAGVGSLASALEIFKRLRLWAEVALCLASAAAAEDEDGRGSGGEEKAKGIIRWRLFQPTGSSPDPSEDDIGEDVMYLKGADFSGPEREPTPPNAPRLWCILGDLENVPAHYERAWEISKHRYARAQKSLGEHYLQQKELEKARVAYKKATAANRLSPEMWSRLGDISLRLAQFEDAAEAFSRSIGCASDTAGGEDARTWSNLGSALWSLYCEVIAEKKDEVEEKKETLDDEEEDDRAEKASKRNPGNLLAQSLAAYKKGASIAHDNWRIWDNVVTLASRVSPPAVPEMILALKQIVRIKKSEDCLDADVLAAMLQDIVLSKEKEPSTGIYEPPRGSMERLVTRLFEEEIVPIITNRSELWAIVSRLRSWRRDYAGSIEAAERAWRAAVGSSGSGLLPGAGGDSKDWTSDEKAFGVVVERTDQLVSVLENWGPDVETVGIKWKGKARNAVRSVMGRARENWEGTDGWKVLENLMEGLKSS